MAHGVTPEPPAGSEQQWRTGNRNARNIYRVTAGDEHHVGCMFTESYGRSVVAGLNELRELRARDEAAKAVVREWAQYRARGWTYLTNALDALARAHETGGRGAGPAPEIRTEDDAMRYLYGGIHGLGTAHEDEGAGR